MSVRLAAPLGLLAALAITLGAGVASGGAKSTSHQALFATMTGKKEVGPDGRKGAGDADGFGSFTAIRVGNRLCYGITVAGTDTPVAAHIHRGGPNVGGPVVVPLTQPAAGNGGASSACVAVEPALLSAIFKNPSKYYVNVHTQPFPGGAVRAQLRRR